jgi:hypothetical protein
MGQLAPLRSRYVARPLSRRATQPAWQCAAAHSRHVLWRERSSTRGSAPLRISVSTTAAWLRVKGRREARGRSAVRRSGTLCAERRSPRASTASVPPPPPPPAPSPRNPPVGAGEDERRLALAVGVVEQPTDALRGAADDGRLQQQLDHAEVAAAWGASGGGGVGRGGWRGAAAARARRRRACRPQRRGEEKSAARTRRPRPGRARRAGRASEAQLLAGAARARDARAAPHAPAPDPRGRGTRPPRRPPWTRRPPAAASSGLARSEERTYATSGACSSMSAAAARWSPRADASSSAGPPFDRLWVLPMARGGPRRGAECRWPEKITPRLHARPGGVAGC